MTITNETQIPRAARSAVRIFIRSQAGFPAWAEARNIPSHNVKNGDLLDYAIQHGLEADVQAILDANSFAGAHQAVCDIVDAEYERERQSDNEAAAAIRAYDLDGLLAPVDAFLSPLVKAEISKALAPLVDAANRPERVVTITVDNSAKANNERPHAYPLPEKRSVGQLFGFRGKNAGNLVTCWESHGAAPARDLYYVADPFTVNTFASAVDEGINVWLTGPSGSGKTTLPTQYAALTGRPLVALSFTRQTEVADMIGGPGVKGGDTLWEDGVLIQAVKRPGTIIVLDEFCAAPAGVQFVFHSLAQSGGYYTLPTGEKVTCAPGVVFVVADNTRGLGDENGNYQGTNVTNQALVNRFGVMLKIEYMSKADEAKALVQHTGCTLPVATMLADFVSRARKLPEMDGVVLSLRQMIVFIRMTVKRGFSAKDAAGFVFFEKLANTEQATLKTLFTLTWETDFDNLVSGNFPAGIDPTAPATPAPSGSAASQAFNDGMPVA